MKVKKPVSSFYDPYYVFYRSTLGGRVVRVVDHSRKDEGLDRWGVVSEEEWKRLMRDERSVRRAARRVVLNSSWETIIPEERHAR